MQDISEQKNDTNKGTPDALVPQPQYEDMGMNKPRRQFSLLGIGLAVLLATATFFSGFHLGSVKDPSTVASYFKQETLADNSVDLSEFWEVWKLLEQKYVTTTSTPLTNEEKVRGAIDGLVRSYGDPYTIYLPPQEAASFEEDISGNFSGVGMEVGIRDNVITIISPLPGSPAEKGGLMAGDSIVSIDDVTTENMSIDEAVKRIRGKEGTEVRFSIFRKGEEEFKTITIVRETISIPTSKFDNSHDDVFIISLYSFNAISDQEMQNALREYVKSKKKKLIIDLRGNPGGYLQSAVAIASYFLPVGETIVRESFGGNAKEEVYRSSGRELGSSAPKKMVVLVDGGSASASEILAGALQEHKIATLIGSQTFGKGSVQELVKLEDDSSLKVTVARWLTPNGVSISHGGLTPDIVVERTVEDREAKRDPQLEAALEFMRK